MAFRRAGKKESYPFEVAVEMIDDHGKRVECPYKAIFKRLSNTEVMELMTAIQRGEITDQEVCRKVLDGWEQVLEDDGSPMSFNEDSLKDLLEQQGFARDTTLAWMRSVGKGRVKN